MVVALKRGLVFEDLANGMNHRLKDTSGGGVYVYPVICLALLPLLVYLLLFLVMFFLFFVFSCLLPHPPYIHEFCYERKLWLFLFSPYFSFPEKKHRQLSYFFLLASMLIYRRCVFIKHEKSYIYIPRSTKK